jgi:hypothetical protein
MTDSTINKVTSSGILTIDLLDFAPKEKSVFLNIKDFLYEGLIVKEKEFKKSLSEVDWSTYRDKTVAIGCSTDAIIPPWVYMYIGSHLQGVATEFNYCSPQQLDLDRWKINIASADLSQYKNEKVVVRAHSSLDPSLYLYSAKRLKPIVKTLMYGEAGLPKVVWKYNS